jgi:hypothetical protein
LDYIGIGITPNQREYSMRRLIVAAVSLAFLGLALPVIGSTSADARHYRGHSTVVVIKKNRGHHYGWYKKRHRQHHRHGGARVIIR